MREIYKMSAESLPSIHFVDDAAIVSPFVHRKRKALEYIMYIIKRGNYNPVIGIAAVSCVPTTAKVAQKIVSKDNPDSFVLGDALGANISGVITSAIITGIYITIIPYL